VKRSTLHRKSFENNYINALDLKFKIMTQISKLFLTALLCVAGLCYAAKAIELPDGSYFPLREGESVSRALSEARRLYPASFEITLPPEKTMDMDWYNDCIQKVSTSPNMSNSALGVAMGACEYKAVPKKCRAFAITKAPNGKESGDARMRCIEECRNANYYSKSVGECSKG